MLFKLITIGLVILSCQINQNQCNVCKSADQTTNCVSSKSKYVRLDKYNDFNLDNSYLLNSFDQNNNKLKCLASCSSNDLCYFVVIKQNKCYICSEILVYYLNYNNSNGNSLIYMRTDQKLILIYYFISFLIINFKY